MNRKHILTATYKVKNNNRHLTAGCGAVIRAISNTFRKQDVKTKVKLHSQS